MDVTISYCRVGTARDGLSSLVHRSAGTTHRDRRPLTPVVEDCGVTAG